MKKLTIALILTAILLSIPANLSALALGVAPHLPLAGAAVTIYPTFVIKAVDADTTVTIMTDNLPPNDTFVVTMGAMGTKGVNGIKVGTTNSGTGGRLTLSYSIPAALHGSYQIAIRMESPTSHFYAFNWFYNSDANLPLITTTEPTPTTTTTTTPTATPAPVYSGYPTFSIQSVVKGSSVTIKGNNFRPNDTYLVRMNWMMTRGVAGTIVETVTTDANGNLSDVTYSIPDFLVNSYQIAIRLESPTTGYYAFNWFYNNNAP
jgi:hypothetical protein